MPPWPRPQVSGTCQSPPMCRDDADSAGPWLDPWNTYATLSGRVNWQELLSQRQQRINDFTEGLGHTLRASLHSDQRLPAIAAYDEERCNSVLDH